MLFVINAANCFYISNPAYKFHLLKLLVFSTIEFNILHYIIKRNRESEILNKKKVKYMTKNII